MCEYKLEISIKIQILLSHNPLKTTYYSFRYISKSSTKSDEIEL